jgi:phosphotransacetylase
MEKLEMRKMLEDILSKRSSDDADVMQKEHPISKILQNNIESIKNIAKREGISINQLIKILKSE